MSKISKHDIKQNTIFGSLSIFLSNQTHFLRANHSETKLATLTHDILASKKLSHLVSYNTKRFPECNYDLGLGANDSGIML